MERIQEGIENLTMAVNAISNQQQHITDLLVQNEVQTTESNVSPTIIDRPEPTIDDAGKKNYKIYEEDIKSLIDLDGSLPVNHVNAILRTIRTLRRNSVTKIKSDLARTEYIDKSWESIPWHEKKDEIALFEKLVKNKTGVDLSVCAGNWATNYLLATTWNNKNSGKRRKERTQRTNENEALNSSEDQGTNNERNEETGQEKQTNVPGSIVRSTQNSGPSGEQPNNQGPVLQRITETTATATTFVNQGQPVIERSQAREIYEGPTLQGGFVLETTADDGATSQISETAPAKRRRLGARRGVSNELNRVDTGNRNTKRNNNPPQRSSRRKTTQ
ncbi:hypothetical protein BDC45DRAFT_542550 [Circinella umbellata]|nr:hypothetical protein BDC45DRAFT_542550 [Circinella umbellata]